MIDKEVLDDVIESVFNSNKPSAIKTGFHDLDEILRGAKKSSLVVIGARPAMGKTAFAMNIMQNFLQNKKKCLFFSLEMSQINIIKRLVGQICEMKAQLLFSPEFLQENHKIQIQKALETVSEYDLTIDDTSNITIEQIKAKIEAEKPEYVFIDYLQLICMPENKSIVDCTSEIMAELKLIAKDNNCMIFVNSQLTRAPENRSNHRPLLSDLKSRGAVAESADIVMFLYRDAYYNMVFDDEDDGKSVYSEKNTAEIIVAKNKTGPVSCCRLMFKGEILKFYNRIIADIF